jgi:hypothetical protein
MNSGHPLSFVEGQRLFFSQLPFFKGELSPVLTLTPLSKEGEGRFFGANDAEIVQTLLTHHVYIPGSLTPIGGFATFLVISSTSHKFENFKARGQWL